MSVSRYICFLYGILGHVEAKCPRHFEDDFEDPSEEMPYGAWMRADRAQTGDSRPVFRVFGSNEVHVMTGRVGASYEQVVSQKENNNNDPCDRTLQLNLLTFTASSGSSESKGPRKRIHVAKNKRKAMATPMNEIQGPGASKKTQLQLRDEDEFSMAETADHNELHILELSRDWVYLDS